MLQNEFPLGKCPRKTRSAFLYHIQRALLATLACLIALAQHAPGQPPDAGELTARQLLDAGEKAFNAGNWDIASESFIRFIADFGTLQETADVVNRVKPLLAICHIRQARMNEAMPLIEESLKIESLTPALRSDLVFFGGLGALHTGDTTLARKYLGAAFNDTGMERGRRMEALMLGGLSYAMEQDWSGALTFFERYGTEIADFSPEAGARAKILQLHALMQEERWSQAVELAQAIHAALDDTRQVVTFASMLIRLGDHFIHVGEPHRAIVILRMVPPKSEIIRLQGTRLAEANLDLNSAERADNTVRTAQLRTAISEMERELDAFEKIPEFDSAARLRMASAYFQLNRIREAALILDQMVRQMEPDAIVESATAALLRAWMSLDRHRRAVRTVELYIERCGNLPEKPNLPEVMFLKGQALEGLFDHAAAADAYLDTAAAFPKEPIAPRAEFMAAYNILQLENHRRAGDMLDRQMQKLKKSDEMWPHVVFWRAMAWYFDQEWENARNLLHQYLADAAAGIVSPEYVDDASFRIAYSHFSEARYPESISLLQEFEQKFATSEWLPEALLTLGDAHAAIGELTSADDAYSRISVDAPGIHDEGWMKRGNILKVTDDLDGMKQHFSDFLDQRRNSPRIAEALQSLGWIAKQEGDIASARRIYWDAIEKFGNDAVRPGLEEIFLTLQSLYTPAERTTLESRLLNLLIIAQDTRRKRFATRLGWAIAQLHFQPNSDESGNPADRTTKYHNHLASLIPQIDPKETAPRILADVADALSELGDHQNAAILYDGLRKWWPRSPERDRAFAGLGFIAAKNGDVDTALDWLARYERTSIMPKDSPDDNGIALIQGELGGKVAMTQADLLAKRDPDQATLILLAVQKDRSMPTRTRAEALMKTAELHVSRAQYRESLPYFEQIYILYNRFPEMVADAYYGRGRALECLSMPDKAREVFSEIANRPDLAEFESTRLARSRAIALGGIIPPDNPANSIIPKTAPH